MMTHDRKLRIDVSMTTALLVISTLSSLCNYVTYYLRMFPIPMIIFASTILKRKPQVRGFILELLCGYLVVIWIRRDTRLTNAL
jgi:hypothetical protein